MITELQTAALSVICAAGDRGVRPAGLCYSLVDSGHIVPQHGRKLKAQGAGFVGGKIIAQLYRAGLVYASFAGRGSGGGWVATTDGKKLAASQPPDAGEGREGGSDE